jgi:exodeoxyribonuclease VII large subunit
MLFDHVDYLTVSEINAQARMLLEESYADVCVLGEVSNFKSHTSGHLYFTLKDSGSQLRAVCFRREASRIAFDMQDGVKVLARGRLTVYEAYGQYQLVAYAIEEFGAGELELAFRKLKEKLEQEGLFDPEQKRDLPAYPAKIAVVTSPTGAAVRDIISTLSRRWPAAEALVCPVAVQGRQAAPEITRMLDTLAERDDIDLVILGRGGGSLEDLWAFNEETVARAIHRCPIPVISAVGHETDFTIADFVADARAATPTMAAEMAVPLAAEVLGGLEDTLRHLAQAMTARLQTRTGRLRELLRSYALGQVRGRLEQAMQTHDHKMDELRRCIGETIRAKAARYTELVTRLKGLDARAILARGYTLCSDAATGAIVRSVGSAVRAGSLRVTFHDGDVLTEVKEKIHEQSEK